MLVCNPYDTTDTFELCRAHYNAPHDLHRPRGPVVDARDRAKCSECLRESAARSTLWLLSRRLLAAELGATEPDARRVLSDARQAAQAASARKDLQLPELNARIREAREWLAAWS